MSAAVPGTPVTSANPNTTTNTSLSVALGSTTVGDLNVITLAGLASGTGINPTVTTPTGWVKVFEQMSNSGTPSTFVATYWRFYQAGDGSSVTFNWAHAGQMVASCEPFSNADTTTPIPYSTSIPHASGAGATYAITGTTGADDGLLVYGGANKTGTAWSNLSDNDAGQRTETSSATMCQRITAAELAGGTAYSKTMTGSASTIGVQWAFIVKGAASTAASGSVTLALSASGGGQAPATGSAALNLAVSGTATAPASGTAVLALAASGAGPSASGTVGLNLTTAGTAPTAGAAGTSALNLTASASSGAPAAGAVTLAFSAAGATPIVRQLLNGGIQWPAHRNGTYATYGEETLEGYQAAYAQYSKAILEISVWDTSDGVYVCSHDSTTSRVFSGTNYTINSTTWATLSPNGTSTAGRPTTIVGGNPMRRLEEILDAFPAGLFIVENKHGTNQATLSTLLDSHAPGRWMFKGPYNDTANANVAAGHGAPMWLYFYPSQLGSLSTTYSAVSGSGVPIVFGLGDYSTAPVPVQSDATTFFSFTAANGIKTWAHILGTTGQKTTADGQASTAGSSFTGYMTSSYPTLAPNDASTGTVTLNLTAAGATQAAGSGSVALALAAAGGAQAPAAGTVALNLTVAGATGSQAAGASSLAMTAGGSAASPASGAAVLNLRSGGTGQSPAGGAGILTFTAAGSTAAPAAGTVSIALTGTATYTAPTAGGAALTFTAAAAAAAAASGSALLNLLAAGTAAGTAQDVSFTATIAPRAYRFTAALGPRVYRFTATIGGQP